MTAMVNRLRFHLWISAGLIPVIWVLFEILKSGWIVNLFAVAGISAFILVSGPYIGAVVGLSTGLGIVIAQDAIEHYVEAFKEERRKRIRLYQ